MKNLALVALIFAVAGCGSAKKAEVIGSYRADRGYGIETLELKKDGTYEQTFVSPAVTQKTSARWTYYPENSHVVLDDVFLFDDGDGRQIIPPKRTNWSLTVDRFLGSVSLVYGEATPFTKTKK